MKERISNRQEILNNSFWKKYKKICMIKNSVISGEKNKIQLLAQNLRGKLPVDSESDDGMEYTSCFSEVLRPGLIYQAWNEPLVDDSTAYVTRTEILDIENGRFISTANDKETIYECGILFPADDSQGTDVTNDASFVNLNTNQNGTRFSAGTKYHLEFESRFWELEFLADNKIQLYGWSYMNYETVECSVNIIEIRNDLFIVSYRMPDGCVTTVSMDFETQSAVLFTDMPGFFVTGGRITLLKKSGEELITLPVSRREQIVNDFWATYGKMNIIKCNASDGSLAEETGFSFVFPARDMMKGHLIDANGTLDNINFPSSEGTCYVDIIRPGYMFSSWVEPFVSFGGVKAIVTENWDFETRKALVTGRYRTVGEFINESGYIVIPKIDNSTAYVKPEPLIYISTNEKGHRFSTGMKYRIDYEERFWELEFLPDNKVKQYGLGSNKYELAECPVKIVETRPDLFVVSYQMPEGYITTMVADFEDGYVCISTGNPIVFLRNGKITERE